MKIQLFQEFLILIYIWRESKLAKLNGSSIFNILRNFIQMSIQNVYTNLHSYQQYIIQGDPFHHIFTQHL